MSGVTTRCRWCLSGIVTEGPSNSRHSRSVADEDRERDGRTRKAVRQGHYYAELEHDSQGGKTFLMASDAIAEKLSKLTLFQWVAGARSNEHCHDQDFSILIAK